MSLLQRHRWFAAAAGITAVFALVSLTAHKSTGLTAFADIVGFLVMVLAAAVILANAIQQPPEQRSFWALMTLGFSLWACNQGAWMFTEVFLHRAIPDPYAFDIVLFFHPVPMIAAVAWRPDQARRPGSVPRSVLNFLMLLGWWSFLYAFIVVPHQYVMLDVRLYNVYYDHLYLVENGLLLAVLALSGATSSGGWKKVYLHFFGAALLYGVVSQFLDRAVANNTYYSGSLYDVPLLASVVWMAAAALSAREWDLETVEFRLDRRLKKIVPRLAMLAILSLPVLGLWAALLDKSAAPSREFRVFAVLGAMLLLGTFVFLRQYFQDQTLMELLQESRRGYESQTRLQTQLVQKEKLASLGTLVAGAAHEIDHPLAAIMTYSEQLSAQERLTIEQNTLLRKIVTQAKRTRDLVTDLLSFAQQAPGEKVPVDLSILLHRAVQMQESRHATGKIRLTVSIEENFPRVQGNANQLFQACVEIIENAMDALADNGGGALQITAQRQGNEAVLQFSDSGPGVRDPQRVFDPFYTTKPVGKGTGLGLSAVYGVIQEHNGQITCQNKPEGGALFVVRFPVAAAPVVQVAGAAAI